MEEIRRRAEHDVEHDLYRAVKNGSMTISQAEKAKTQLVDARIHEILRQY